MNAATIAQLLVQFGLPLTQQLYTLFKTQGNAPITDQQWADLLTLSQYRSTDSLAAAGIKIVDGKVVNI